MLTGLEGDHRPRESRLRRGLTAATLLAIAIGAPGDIRQPEMPREPNPNQLTGIFAYGHREPEMMLRSGNIADGFIPVDGLDAEYGEKDVELIYQKLRGWKEAGIDFVAFSWHSTTNARNQRDVRDRFFDWFLNDVMMRCDNPHPDLMATATLELDSVRSSISEETRDRQMEHFEDHYFPNPHFLINERNQPVLFEYAQELEGIIDNPGYLEGWAKTASKHNVFINLEDYLGSNLNPHHDDPNIGLFNYAGNFLQFPFPPRLDITGDVARVTISYSKAGDLKQIPYDEREFGLAVDKAMASDAPIMMINSDNEAVENNKITPGIVRILNERLLKRRAQRMSLIDSPEACTKPGNGPEYQAVTKSGENVIVTFPS